MKLSQRVEKIVKKLTMTGANFAGSANKFISPSDGDVMPTYHIHTDVYNPLVGNILRFKNLNDLEDYANVRLEARKASDEYANQFDCPTGVTAMAVNTECVRLQAEIMRNFWNELN